MPQTLSTEGLKNKKLRIHFIRPGLRKPREVIGLCIDADPTNIVLSLRPKAGTSTFPTSWIIAIWETQQPIKLPEPIPDGETRLF